LKTYCLSCHGEAAQKADRRFDQLADQIGDDDMLVDYQDIVDLLNLGEMPPEEEKQPSDQERLAVVELLTAEIQRFHRTRRQTGGQTVLRRLNAREYRNTVRDLLHLDMTLFDPTSTFPRDQTSEHLDNVGDTLVVSGHLLARYLESAERVIEKAMTPLEKPQRQTWVFRDGFRQQPEIDQVHRKTNQFQHMTLYDVTGADKPEGAYGPIHAFAQGVPVDGLYEIRIKAEAVNRLHPYDPEFLGTDPEEPLRLGIVPGDHTVGNLHLPQPNEPLLAEIDLQDEPAWYTVRVWLDQGITPRFTFENGLMDARNLWSRVIRKYPDLFPKNIAKGIVAARFNAIKHGKLPQIHIHEIEIEGPCYDHWPTESHRALLGNDWQEAVRLGNLSPQEMRPHLRRFMTRAYRRPVQDQEIDRIMEVIRVRRQTGRSALDAYGDGLKAVLCSPAFLYLDEAAGTLSGHALATRLSYFLWSSMPDDELIRLAGQGRLSDPSVLEEQVNRMLRDAKSDAFVDGFLDSWLTFRELGATPPDRGDFRPFYHYHLDRAMRDETRLFTRHLIDENLDIANFLDSKFTFVNKPLAKLYGIDPPETRGFSRVALTDPRRGGLLGQASVLTVTANGIDTSPVVRGVWLLENLLGTPPTPPPPDVEPLDPDTRGAKTIRDQLLKHRHVASCNECHRKIDPLGFALENFDPIGRWRERYDQGGSVDASGNLPGGKAFKDVVGFKRILLERKQLFSQALASKLLAYAMGRRIEPADRPQIDRI
ncbi:MAG: DUF1592 domain-containing protein, partial [Pirellulales bacterium]|nr:DUF1592 domain-containing protein [Pirellulales bacterium]